MPWQRPSRSFPGPRTGMRDACRCATTFITARTPHTRTHQSPYYPHTAIFPMDFAMLSVPPLAIAYDSRKSVADSNSSWLKCTASVSSWLSGFPFCVCVFVEVWWGVCACAWVGVYTHFRVCVYARARMHHWVCAWAPVCLCCRGCARVGG